MEASRAQSSDADKPQLHLAPRAHWLNDPNGPIYYKGRYHCMNVLASRSAALFPPR